MTAKPATSTATIWATLVAGPAFLLSLGFMTLAQNAGNVQHLKPEALAMGLGLGIPALLVGAVLAIIPCTIAVQMLTAIATRFDAMRLPAAWALFGGVSAYGIGLAWISDSELPFIMAGTGVLCALAARSRLCWDDHPRIG